MDEMLAPWNTMTLFTATEVGAETLAGGLLGLPEGGFRGGAGGGGGLGGEKGGGGENGGAWAAPRDTDPPPAALMHSPDGALHVLPGGQRRALLLALLAGEQATCTPRSLHRPSAR